MTKFNYSLNNLPETQSSVLSRHEIEAFEQIFYALEAYMEEIPIDVYSAMEDIEKQFLASRKLTEKQKDYVRGIYFKYILSAEVDKDYDYGHN
jgi:hypothetical protein